MFMNSWSDQHIEITIDFMFDWLFTKNYWCRDKPCSATIYVYVCMEDFVSDWVVINYGDFFSISARFFLLFNKVRTSIKYNHNNRHMQFHMKSFTSQCNNKYINIVTWMVLIPNSLKCVNHVWILKHKVNQLPVYICYM